MPNSEKVFKSWFIENPINKELVKHMTLRFGPKVEKEFILVLKAPSSRLECNMASFVTIKMASLRRAQTEEEKQSEVQKVIKQRSAEGELTGLIEERVVQKKKEIRVMLLGRLENAKIECMRELFHETGKERVIPLCIKSSQAVQKFRIPFRNLSETADTEIDFTFVKMPKESKEEEDLLQFMDFFCQPSSIKLQANSQGFLNAMVKVNCQRL